MDLVTTTRCWFSQRVAPGDRRPGKWNITEVKSDTNKRRRVSHGKIVINPRGCCPRRDHHCRAAAAAAAAAPPGPSPAPSP